ncbi:MAG TPA: fibronectin type III domain-containing protein, partial [Trebonia sp.]|nr:fibronectin type III domain-containing protein [Trebonia sp.]
MSQISPFHSPWRRALAVAVACLAGVAAATMAVTSPAEAAAEASVPSAPLNAAAFADGAHKLLVTWNAPASNGGDNLESYLIDVSDATGAQWFVTSGTAPGSATSAVVSGLQPGISYTATVAAQNPDGVGPASAASNPATVEGPPDAPLDVTLTATAGDQVQANWQTPPGNGAPVTRTVASLYASDGTLISSTAVRPPATSVTFPAAIGGTLPAGHGYYVQLRASNRFGTSGPTADSNVVTTSAAGSPAPAAVTAPPPSTLSDYVMAADDTPAAMNSLGCTQARAESGPEPGRSRLVVLDFGGQYGTGSVLLIPPPVGSAPDTELTYAQVAADAEGYAAGYRQCVAAGAGPLTVGISTNNSLNVSRELGIEWARDVVNPAQAWAAKAFPRGQVDMAASDDIEPGFGAAGPAKAWVAGYVSASDDNALYNIGSADGCAGTTMTGVCDNGWTVGDEYAVNAGLSTRLLRAEPEIYTESGIMAEQWQGISNAGPAAGRAPVDFAGELTEYTTCQIPGIRWCTGIDNTPAQGWDQLYQQLNSSPATAQRSLAWSSDITYSSVPAASDSAAASSGAGSSGSNAAKVRFAPAGDGASSSAPLCTASQLAVSFDGHGQYGGRPVTYYPFVVTNTSDSTCKVAGAQAAAATTGAGETLDLASGAGAADQRETALAPETSAGFALGLSDAGTRCQYLRRFTVRLTGVATPVT